MLWNNWPVKYDIKKMLHKAKHLAKQVMEVVFVDDGQMMKIYMQVTQMPFTLAIHHS